jgi:Phosphotransferase enzyme family
MTMDRLAHLAKTRAGQVPDVVRAALPGFQVRSVVLLGQGMDNLVYDVNGALVVRFSKEPDPARRAELISSEAELLAAIANISPLPVPEPVFTDREHGCWAHAKLPGVPLLGLPLVQRLARAPVVAAKLGTFLAALHAAPARKMAAMRLSPISSRPLSAGPSKRSSPPGYRGPPAPSSFPTTTWESSIFWSSRPPGRSPASSTGATPPSPTPPATSASSTATSARPR